MSLCSALRSQCRLDDISVGFGDVTPPQFCTSKHSFVARELCENRQLGEKRRLTTLCIYPKLEIPPIHFSFLAGIKY